MFIKAIETAAQFTRPIHTISRQFDSGAIIPGSATLFFVNNQGYAITCKHVADILIQAEQINSRYSNFKAEYKNLSNRFANSKESQRLEKKYNYSSKSMIQMKTKFINCANRINEMKIQTHPEHDLALIKFNGFDTLNVTSFPLFKKNSGDIKQGKTLCRLGYPFPEFSNFEYNKTSDEIEWTENGIINSPQFPIDGMLTRFIGDQHGKLAGIEMSTPGLRGQSGGPLFDENGVVYGMQSRTKHMHLGFDLENKPIQVNGQNKVINDYSFLHLGECVHIDVIKDFLRLHKVHFEEV